MFSKCALPYLAVLFLAAPTLCGSAPAVDAPDPAELRKIVSENIAAMRIQTDFPLRPAAREERRDGYPVERAGTAGTPAQAPDSAAAMLWTSLAVFIVVLLLTLYDNIRPRGGSGTGKRRAAPGEADLIRKRMSAVRLESDDLAARGDYAGAMHVLLLQSVEEMRRRLGIPIAASLTSREILRRTRLQADAHDSLADIIGRVEISWFGDHKPGEDEYERCRASFSTLTGILGGGGRT